MKILVLNAGSSSLKFQLIDAKDEKLLSKGSIDRIGMDGTCLSYKSDEHKLDVKLDNCDYDKAVNSVFDALMNSDYGVIQSFDDINAIGHRVVHGGELFRQSHLLDDEVIQVLKDNVEIAPLHNPANIKCIEACKKLMPDVPMIGVFDTAFHSTIPKKAYLYAIPQKAYKEHGIRRYGFHGISHSYVANRAAKLLKKDIDNLKIITCHLGNGSSIAAVDGGKVLDTSMGFTPLEGLIMGTRSGDIDPTVIKFLINKMGLSIDGAIDYLNKKSGVLGVSGFSSDFRDLLEEAENGNKDAELAIEMFCYRIKKYIGSYIAAMNGVDIIAFAGGIGENSSRIRKRIIEGLEWLNINLDEVKNTSKDREKLISSEKSGVNVMVVPTNEELNIAQETAKIIGEMDEA